ncbi:MAG: hypothetical protein ACFFD1_13575 [Candidatus Thorarchaeota archaeon]
MFKEKKKKQTEGDVKQETNKVEGLEEETLKIPDDISKELKALEKDLQVFLNEDPITEQEVQEELKKIQKDIVRENKEKISSEIRSAQFKIKQKKITEDLKEILPLWIEKPIYWITPAEKYSKRREDWIKEWGQFLITYANVKHKFVLVIRELVNEFPFKNSLIKKQLTREQLIIIANYLVEINRASWLDDKQTRLMIIFQTIDETSEELYVWAQGSGREFISIFEMLEDEYWKTLPEEIVRKIFGLLVRQNKAIYVDNKEKNSIRFEFKY